MGKILRNYKKTIVDNIKDSISSNSAYYYAFASNPVAYSGNTPSIGNNDYSTTFEFNWQMLFGKKIANTDIMPVITKRIWQTNTVYDRYDNTSNTLYESNFYVITQPVLVGGDYLIFKCIDNANGLPSTQTPDQIQQASFQKSDGYIWRYITSISSANYTKFATNDYIPVYPNTTISTGSYNYSGVELVVITNTGNGYSTYHDGTIRSVVNSTLIQIEANASTDNDFYTNNAIYIYNVSENNAQLKTVGSYVSNSSGNWIGFNTPANTTNITSSITKYKISPKVIFNTDGVVQPSAYSVVNTSSNTIEQVVIIDTGYGITRANVSFQSNSSYGTGANAYAIISPSGGHGYCPETELDIKGYCVSFNFSNSESNTIPTNIGYNKIGIIKNPSSINANGTKGSSYTSTTFSQILKANVSPSTIFTVGDTVKGSTSNNIGTVAFSNSTVIYLTGDKFFSNGETIVSSNGLNSANITINTLGSIYTRDINPLYVQNIDNVTRSNSSSESFKIVVQV